MAYLTTCAHCRFERCYASINESTGVARVWISLSQGAVTFNADEIDGLINALSDALTDARALEAERAKS